MKKSFFILLLLSLSGCATVISDKIQTVNIKVIDQNNELLSNAACVVVDPYKESFVVHGNPGVAHITRGHGDLKVTCNKAGYTQGPTATAANFNATTLANVLFFPGFIVDAATGAYKKYPSHLIVTMQEVKS